MRWAWKALRGSLISKMKRQGLQFIWELLVPLRRLYLATSQKWSCDSHAFMRSFSCRWCGVCRKQQLKYVYKHPSFLFCIHWISRASCTIQHTHPVWQQLRPSSEVEETEISMVQTLNRWYSVNLSVFISTALCTVTLYLTLELQTAARHTHHENARGLFIVL